ncbi:glycosyltransferase [Candidatus Parcubacteria bacterium]|nr:glycosyltransferase [Candidatus Parcubacteria bacterium]
MNTVISQALATGLPVITTKHSGLPDQVKDGKNGFLVLEGDYKALAEKILYYMNHPKLWPEFGKFGRKHVLENYDAKLLIDKQVECYYDVIEDKE